MSLADELRKLQELRKSGALTEAEFEQAKASLLKNPYVEHGVTLPASTPSQSVSDAPALREKLLKDYDNISVRKSYLAARTDWERMLDSGLVFRLGVLVIGLVAGAVLGVIVGQGAHPLFGAIGPIGMAVVGAGVGPIVAVFIAGNTDEHRAFWSNQAELGPLPKGRWQDKASTRKRFLGD